MTKTEVKVVEVPVVQPIEEELLVDHYPIVPLSQNGTLTIAEISGYINELQEVIKKYRADKAALRSLGSEE